MDVQLLSMCLSFCVQNLNEESHILQLWFGFFSVLFHIICGAVTIEALFGLLESMHFHMLCRISATHILKFSFALRPPTVIRSCNTLSYVCGALQLCLLYLDETTGASVEAWVEFNERLASCRWPQARVLPH